MTEAKNIIKAWDYWPAPPLGRIVKFHYVDVGPEPDTNIPGTMPDMHSWFVWDDKSDSILYVDYDKDMKWKDTWYLRYKIGYGIAEWRDDNIIEKESISTKIFGNRNKIVFQDKKPIWWGDYCEIGKDYQNNPKSDFFACSPPQMLNGTQSFNYTQKLDKFTTKHGDTYKDVLVLIYQQSWGNKTGGAKYWMARGIGPVAVQWISTVKEASGNKIYITNRMDAKYRMENGFAKDIQT